LPVACHLFRHLFCHGFLFTLARSTHRIPSMTPARSVFLMTLLAPAVLCAGPALAQSNGPSLVIDAASGAVLHEEVASQAWHPASTTKIMTAYVALRAVRAGRIGLQTAIPASALAARQPRVKVYIRAGQEITLDNALRIMMVKSANDISYVIAEGVGGTVPAFIEMMNAEARRLGLRDTAFRNPNGWHHPEQQSSARDLAVLTMTMMREFPEYADYWGIGAVQLGKVTLNNTNGLIGRYAGANGFKTGFVCASGFNVVATATRGGRTLIAVVLGAYSGAERTIKAAQILDAAFTSWGGTGRSVASIGASGTRARNICAEVRAFGRGAPLADDVETSGAISFAPPAGSDSSGMYALFAGPQASTMRGTGGRITLGPRAQFTPIPVAYGRSAGSASAPLAANVSGRPASAVAAARPGTPAAPGALAPAGAVAGAIAARAAAAAFTAPGEAAPRGAASGGPGPIKLQGAIGQAGPAALRPSSAAGIRPKPAPARPATASVAPSRPAAAKPTPRAGTTGVAASPASKPAASRPAAPPARPATLPPRRPPPPAE
jgi:D-alanyl-D-alanine carboxypeptidase